MPFILFSFSVKWRLTSSFSHGTRYYDRIPPLPYLLFQFKQTYSYSPTHMHLSFLPQRNIGAIALVCCNFDRVMLTFQLHSSFTSIPLALQLQLVITPHSLPIEKIPFQAINYCPLQQGLETQGWSVHRERLPLINDHHIQAILRGKSNYHHGKIHSCYFTVDDPVINNYKYTKRWHFETNFIKVFL